MLPYYRWYLILMFRWIDWWSDSSAIPCLGYHNAMNLESVAEIELSLSLEWICFLLCGDVGFVSIDCGSSHTKRYTDALGITWKLDTICFLENAGFSDTSQEILLTMLLSRGQTPYGSVRYFQPHKAMNPTKFYYSLQATGGNY